MCVYIRAYNVYYRHKVSGKGSRAFNALEISALPQRALTTLWHVAQFECISPRTMRTRRAVHLSLRGLVTCETAFCLHDTHTHTRVRNIIIFCIHSINGENDFHSTYYIMRISLSSYILHKL